MVTTTTRTHASLGILPSNPEFEGQDILSIIDFITKGNRSTARDFEEFLDPIRNSGETNTGDLLESPGNGGSSESPGAHRCEGRWWLDGDDGTPRGIVPNFVIPPCSGVQFCDPSDTITISERGRVGDGWAAGNKSRSWRYWDFCIRLRCLCRVH